MQSKARLVIFDWDGTLFDSVGQIVASLQFAAQQHQQPLTSHDAQQIIGLGLPEVMQTLFPQVPDLHASICQTYSSHYIEHAHQAQWFSGIDSLLMKLKAQGTQLAVATGKNRHGLERVMAQTQSHHFFDLTRTANETKSKPNPLMLEEILMETGVSVDETIMVGDSSYDLQMAQNIQMPSVGVTYGAHSRDVLQRYAPIMLVDSVQMLENCLIKYTN